MKRKVSIWGGLIVAAMTTIQAVENHSQPPAASTGAPGEGTCRNCHAGNPLNGGSGGIVVTLHDAAGNSLSGYLPGQTHTVSLTVNHPNFTRFGFQTTVLDANNAAAGNFPNLGSNYSLLVSGGRQYLGHRSTNTSTPLPGEKTWVFQWEAPATDVGPVTFYAAANAANADGGTLGDFIYTATATFSAIAPPPEIAVLPLNQDRLCAGAFVVVGFQATGGAFNAGNVFTAELSNADGQFDPPVVIGSEPGTGSGTVGATIPTGLVAGAGYRIRIKASLPAAISEPSAETYRGVPLPVLNWPQTLNLCSGATVDLPAPVLNDAQYVWLRDGTPLPETGPVLTVAQPGTYALSLTNECGATVEAAVNVVGVQPQIPVITRTGNTLFASPAQTYQWFLNGQPIAGATQSTLMPTENGAYSVATVDANGCWATSEAFDFVYDPGSGPTINAQYAGGDVCAGATVVVEFSLTGTVDAGNEFRLELSNADGAFVSPTTLAVRPNVGPIEAGIPRNTPAGGGYRFRVSATAPATAGGPSAPFAIFSVPELQIVELADGSLTVSPDSLSGTLAWKYNDAPYDGPLDGTQPEGVYVALLTTNDGCLSQSPPYTYVRTSVRRFENMEFVVCPNPATQYVRLQFSVPRSWTASLVDLTGKTFVPSAAGDRLDLGELPDGVYVLKVVSEGREFRQRLVVRR
jgi:hypothetical protein